MSLFCILKIQIPFPFFRFRVIFHEFLENFRHFLLDFLDFPLNHAFTGSLGSIARKIIQPFPESNYRVKLAKFSLLAASQKIHDALARASAPVTSRAKRGDVAHGRKVANKLVEGPGVAEDELLAVRLLRLLRVAISAEPHARRSVHLRNAEPNHSVARFGFFPRSQDHPGIRNGKAQNHDGFSEVRVAYRMRRPTGKGRIFGGFEPWKRNRVRAKAEFFFKFDRDALKPHDFEFPVVEAEQRPDAHVFDSGFHGAMHAIKPPCIIRLRRIFRMQGRIGFVMIGFLKHLIGAYSCLVKHGQIAHVHGRGIDIDAANRAPAVFPRVFMRTL